jgi:DNA-binding LacI/PurR family transcriptional regulator
MAVTLQDVADRAGVSKSAVSRTFTAGASVSDRTRAKVEAAAAELGYHPNVLASSLTTGRTKLIGLVSNNFTNPYFLEIFDRFTQALQQAGLRPLLVNLAHEGDAVHSLDMLRQYSVDGVIVASSTLPPDFTAAFRAAGLPVVHAFGWSRSAPDTDLVSIDNIAAGKLAAETLLARGYGRIGFLGGPREASTTQDRLTGFQARAGAAFVGARFAPAYAFDAGRATMRGLLQDGPGAEAWFCGDDVIAIGALSALRDAGLKVPGQVGILGLNDMEMAGWENIGLTTIRQPIAEIVAASVALIEASIADAARRPETRMLPCSLIERETLRPLP